MNMASTRALFIVLVATCISTAAERWKWPDDRDAASAEARIDGKVGFIDGISSDRRSDIYNDDLAFHQPHDTQGFYNRPPGVGRYEVRVEPHSTTRQRYNVDDSARRRIHNVFHQNRDPQETADGTLDSIKYCKCVSNPDCKPRTDLPKACSPGLHLCCYNSKQSSQQNTRQSDFFNEVDDEQSHLTPGHVGLQGPFTSRPEQGSQSQHTSVLFGPEGSTGNIGPLNKQVVVGRDGPIGIIGPTIHRQDLIDQDDIGENYHNTGVLVGPGGPSGIIGPAPHASKDLSQTGPAVLVGPSGPTGIIGPASNRLNNYPERELLASNQNPGVLVGPEGPTGIIGPSQLREDNRGSASAQNGILVGPGGPTGLIGPRGYGRPVLVGPGGPTGIIGPGGYYGRPNPGVLVGPGGPTGIIGPRRGVLVGPGGPTGQIGPRNYFYGK